MRLISLKVVEAHGYLNLDVQFNKQLTFLIGINGSGKTTVLRLIEALLTPSLQVLDKIPHKRAELRFSHEKKIIKVISKVDETGTTIKIPFLKESGELTYSRDDLESVQVRSGSPDQSPDRNDVTNAHFANHPVIQFLRKTIDTPLFLGLDRKNIALHFDDGAPSANPRLSPSRREMILHSMRRRMPVSGQLGSSLVDVQVLIQEIYRKTREEQETFARKLREQMFLHAFDVQPSAGFLRTLEQGHSMPAFLVQIASKRGDVEKALRDAGLSTEQFFPVVNKFFIHVDELIKKYNETSKEEKVPPSVLVDLALNRPVVDRIQKLIATSDSYNANVNTLWAPINTFLTLVNRFLTDTEKNLEIDQVGLLNVRLLDGTLRSLDVLSSGERQIVVILGHLAINRELNRAGVFVVDEPELSLHLKWQQIFVDSLLEASPKNQFILATHSPEIVVDRTDECESLDKLVNSSSGED